MVGRGQESWQGVWIINRGRGVGRRTVPATRERWLGMPRIRGTVLILDDSAVAALEPHPEPASTPRKIHKQSDGVSVHASPVAGNESGYGRVSKRHCIYHSTPEVKVMTTMICGYKSQQEVALGGEGADRDFDAHWIDAESSFAMLGSQP